MRDGGDSPPEFNPEFRAAFRDLVLWRRDVRRFSTDPVAPGLVTALIELASHAPSVGHCQPWRFVLVEDAARRATVKASFASANAAALEGYDGAQRQLYAQLKLEGLDAAPVHLAVFADEHTEAGAGLGRQTMPETLRYSVVAAVQTLWLGARTHGLGVGWISILDPDGICASLDIPKSWRLIAYLCLGWPQENHLEPELVRSGWQERVDITTLTFRR